MCILNTVHVVFACGHRAHVRSITKPCSAYEQESLTIPSHHLTPAEFARQAAHVRELASEAQRVDEPGGIIRFPSIKDER